jgi:hypothetical protein
MASRSIDELVLVYAADAGRISALVDSARKLLTLKGCTLCAITHGLAGEKSEWKDCKAALGVPITCYHRDDQPAHIRQAAADRLPCVLARVDDEYRLLLGPESLERCNGKVADLKGRLRHHATLQGLELPGV